MLAAVNATCHYLSSSILVTTMDRVSTLFRRGASALAIGFRKETWGQTARSDTGLLRVMKALTSSMLASFGIVHNEYIRFRVCLAGKPIPGTISCRKFWVMLSETHHL